MYREGLGQHLEQMKTLAPILICSMKIFIQILNQVAEGEGGEAMWGRGRGGIVGEGGERQDIGKEKLET